MKLAPLKYIAPSTLEEAVKVLSQSESGKILAGGQSLLPQLISRHLHCDWLVDIQNIPDCNMIQEKEGQIVISSMARQRDVELNAMVKKQLPLMNHLLSYIGSIAIRNRGTIVGSICQGGTWAEIPLLFVLLGGTLVTQSLQGKRHIAAHELFISNNQTSLSSNEIATAACFPIPAPDYSWGYCEYSQRVNDRALCLAIVIVLIDSLGRVADIKIAIGGVTETPRRCHELENALIGGSPEDSLAVQAGQLAAIQVKVADDTTLATDYRRQLVSTLVCRALLQAFNASKSRKTGGE
ncbi:FAD binding domain-containing protein [Serratia fonticola]